MQVPTQQIQVPNAIMQVPGNDNANTGPWGDKDGLGRDILRLEFEKERKLKQMARCLSVKFYFVRNFHC